MPAVPPSGATTIRDAFDEYRAEFRTITRRARWRFEKRDWQGIQRDSVERLDLYRHVLDGALTRLRSDFGERLKDRRLWVPLKEAFSELTAGRDDRELAETFFNSVTRRIFSTVGVDQAIEFVASDFAVPAEGSGPAVYETFPKRSTTVDLVAQILRRVSCAAPWARLEEDAAAVGDEVDRAAASWSSPGLLAAEVIPTPFFRNKGAYVVGRLRGSGGTLPFVVALLNEPEGIVVDAALLEENAVSIVFGFTRSYFHVDAERPRDLVRFLKSIVPQKRVAELYIAIGHNKHGKTELYRDLLRHLKSSGDRFEIARGERGMVMVVFTLPSYDQVFKVIRDRFPDPKRITRQGVMAKYELVFRHDRAGRLIDAQEFEHLAFRRDRFSEELLEELLATASESVSVVGDVVAIRHLYVERRLAPLNLVLREAEPEAVLAAIVDYGQAIRDLAATNIFPGDVLPKNFGVTRHGRVVFYDYDELCLLSECRFKELPEPPGAFEEMQPEPWFFVAEHDIFPEEFLPFLGLPPPAHDAFLEAHTELLTPVYWRQMQERLRAGEIVDIFPYLPGQRLGRAGRADAASEGRFR